MKKIEIKKFKTTPDLAKMIEEGHKVHAMANGRIQSYERHTPQPEDYSNLDLSLIHISEPTRPY